MNTLLKVDGQKLHSELASLNPSTIAAKNAITGILTHLRTKPLTARDLGSFHTALESAGFDPALNKAKRIVKRVCPSEKLNVAIAFEAIANVKTKQFFDVGVEAQNALSNLYNLNAALILGEINSGALADFKFNPVIAKLIDMAKTAKQVKSAFPDSDDAITGLPGQGTESPIDKRVIPMIALAMIDENTTLVYFDGMFFTQGKNGALQLISDYEAQPYLMGDTNAMLASLRYMFTSDSTQPNLFNATEEALRLLKQAGIPSLSIDMQGPMENALKVNDRVMSIEMFNDMFSTANNEYVVARTSIPGFGDAIQKLIDGVTAMITNRGALMLNLAYRLTYQSDSSNSAIYLGNTKDRFFVIQTMNGSIYSVETFDNAYAVLASNVLTSNTSAHLYASTLFTEDLDSEASRFNAKKKVAEEMSLELESYRDLRRTILSDIEQLKDMPDANKAKIQQLSDLVLDVEDSIDKTEKAIQDLSK